MLQVKWGIAQGPIHYTKKQDLGKIMKTCIILHNMIIEDERDTGIAVWRPLPEETISHPNYIRSLPTLAAFISARLDRIRNSGTNMMLRSDLINHLWNQFGG